MQFQLTTVVNGLKRALARSEQPSESATAVVDLLDPSSAPTTDAPNLSPATAGAPRVKRSKRRADVDASAGALSQETPTAKPNEEVSEAARPEPEPIPVANGVAVVYGYGVKVAIARGHLFLSDGICADRRAGYLNRATSGLKHLVILGHTGSVSLDAFRWLHALGAGVSMIDADGEVIFTSAPLGSDNAHLRRAQALAAYTDVGLDVTRRLLMAKVAGQARVLRQNGQSDVANHLGAAVDTLEGATVLDDMRLIEAHAADAYFDCWATLPIQFARKYADKVAEHWKTFGKRQTGKYGGTRSATTPANALLNYLYAILETETRIALLSVGLDPGLGFLHADTNGRASLALDVMEAVRSDVDAWLLDFMAHRTLNPSEFVELPDGVCRISAKLARELSDTAPLWRARLGPVVEQVASTILTGHKPDAALPTNLTGAKRRQASARRNGRALVLEGKAGKSEPEVALSGSDVRLLAPPPSAVPHVKLAGRCPECGTALPNRKLKFCSQDCREVHEREVHLPKFAASGIAALAAQRVNGSDPSHGGDVGRKRGQTNASRIRDRLEWEKAHPEVDLHAERERFTREILPKLQGQEILLRTIIDGVGVSLRYASLIRQGKVVPHPMHYPALDALVSIDNSPAEVAR